MRYLQLLKSALSERWKRLRLSFRKDSKLRKQGLKALEVFLFYVILEKMGQPDLLKAVIEVVNLLG